MFARHYADKHKEVCLAKATAKAKGGKRKKAVVKKFPEVETALSQEEARAWVPEGGHIWRGITNSTWNGHFPPYQRVSAPWSRFGECGAMRWVIKALWTQWSEKSAVAHKDCPAQGIFDDA